MKHFLALFPTFLFSAVAMGLVSAQENVRTQVPSIQPSNVAELEEEEPKVEVKSNKKVDFTAGRKPLWIWGESTSQNYTFRKTFTAKASQANLIAACDNQMVVRINGRQVLTGDNWAEPVRRDVTSFLKAGENLIEVAGRNDGDSPAGLALKLVLKASDGKSSYVVTDKTWEATKSRGENWKQVSVVGVMGGRPWGNVFATATTAVLAQNQRDTFELQPGFQVELLYDVPRNEQGSWVSICADDKGRLIASDQGGKGLYRITPGKIGTKEPAKVEKLDVKMTSAQGMLHAFGSLYCSVNGGPGSGLYRLQDTTGNDQYDKVEKLKSFAGGGEHGPHAVRLSPDGKSLLVIAGNHTKLPDGITSSRVPGKWQEDLLLPRQWDARGHARGKLAPGGWICRTDPDGKTWEVVSIGYRNPYDMDLNADGELFAYDADMEWDMGTSWYRPTRVVHATSGSEFGWRSGTGKWPSYYVDSLPEMIDIGPGSPVGAEFGYGTKFPAKYQKALYICDWTFGTMYAIHIEPDGSSYKATKEEFVARTPLPLTDATVAADGALYFTIGGRGAQSALFRVTYVGDESTTAVDAKDTNPETIALRNLRKQLEALHAGGPRDGKALAMIVENLGHTDRHIRYAARAALEHQPVANWQTMVLKKEMSPAARIQAVVAVARVGEKTLQGDAIAALEKLPFAKMDETQQLDLLRAYSLVFIRLGGPDQETAQRIAASLEGAFPSKSWKLNRELTRVLVYLQSPTVIGKTLTLLEKESEVPSEDMAALLARNARYGGTIAKMLANQPEIEKIHYALALRNMRYGWTLEQRKRYFDWLTQARTRSGGASYHGFIDNIRKEAVANMSENEKKALAATQPYRPPAVEALPKPMGPGRKWTVDDVVKLTEKGLAGRNFENGKRAFAASRCVTCHRYDGNGGATGPDLTNVAGRFGYRELAEALIEPSKVISDQYRGSIVETANGKSYTGRILNKTDEGIELLIDPVDVTKVVKIKTGDIDAMVPSRISLMPGQLLDSLNEDELLDLLAYLLSRGNPQDRLFAKGSE